MVKEKIEALRGSARQAEQDLAWHEARLPPPMTPRQFTALLDELCEVGCCERRTRQGEPIYVISVSEIQEGDLILSGAARPTGDPLRTAILRAIGQFHSIDISLEQISNGAAAPVLEEISRTKQINREAIAELHRVHDR
jgi:hypothetical protein